MAQLTPTTFSTNEAPTAAKLTSAFADVATAFNAVNSTNLAADSVPLTALATDGTYHSITMVVPTISAGVAVGTVQMGAAIPIASAKIVAVNATCTAIGGAGGDHYFDVYSQTTGASVLSAKKAMTTANTGYAGVVSLTTARAVSEVLTVRAETPGGGSFANLVVTILLKNQLVAY